LNFYEQNRNALVGNEIGNFFSFFKLRHEAHIELTLLIIFFDGELRRETIQKDLVKL